MKLLGALLATAVISGSVISSSAAQASTQFNSEADRNNYYTIHTVKISPVETDEATIEALRVFYSGLTSQAAPAPRRPIGLPPVGVPPVGLPLPGGGSANATDPLGIQQWITVGERVWQLIASNRPIANITTNRVSVLPKAQPDWVQIENWQGPASHTYLVEAINGFGMTVVHNRYTIAWNYGGTYENVGAYIGNLTMIPTDINVTFGFTLNSQVTVGDAVNMSSTKDPVPALNFQVDYSITSLITHLQGAESFFITGKGEFKKIN